MKIMKCVQQQYVSAPIITNLMENFRMMLNDCIRLGVKENISSMKQLSLKCYPYLKRYNVLSYYKLCAISRASGILKNYHNFIRKGKKVKVPYVFKPQLVTCYGFKIKDGKLLLPSKVGECVEIPLNSYVRMVLAVSDLKVRSITLTPDKLSLSIAKEVESIKPETVIGIDCNLANVTTASLSNKPVRYDLSKIASIKSQYKNVKSHMKRNDIRVRKKVFRKYGKLEKNKAKWILHNTSKNLVAQAKQDKSAIVMENLNGIRKLYRRGNGQGCYYRGLMNSWMFREFQRQVEYKAKWEGLPVHYVNPKNTSAKCSRCGHKMLSKENRKQTCTKCKFHIDRDVNASLNLMKRGMRFVPVALQSEGMIAESVSGNPHTRLK